MGPPSGEEFRFGDRMTDLEALFWRLEGIDPLFRSAMNVVVTLASPPDTAAFLERIDIVSRRIPRLRDRVAEGGLDMVPPRWEPDPAFDLAHHLRRVSVGGAGGAEDLLAVAETAMSQPFPRGRPPWQMTFVGGLSSGREGVVMRLHHSYTDGMGAVKLALELFDTAADPGEHPVAPRLPSSPRPPLLGRMVEDLAYEARRSAALARRIVPWAVRGVVDAVVNPWERAGFATDLVGRTGSMVREASVPGSPVMRSRCAAVRLGSIDLPLQGMRQVARRAGGTVNDVFLAGLLGGMALYHEKHGSPLDSLRVAMPVSTRGGATEEEMRNQVQAVLLRVPMHQGDPEERLRLVRGHVSEALSEPGLALIEDAMALGVRLPGLAHVLSRVVRGVDVVASNLPGPPDDLYLSGSRVESIVPIGPRSGAAVNLTLLSYRDTVHIGVNIDPAAVPDSPVLMDCLRSGYEELLLL